jgi:hypothetical protein
MVGGGGVCDETSEEDDEARCGAEDSRVCEKARLIDGVIAVQIGRAFDMRK